MKSSDQLLAKTSTEPDRGQLVERIYSLQRILTWLKSECRICDTLMEDAAKDVSPSHEDYNRLEQRIDFFECLVLEILDIETKEAILKQSSIKTSFR